MFEVCTSTWLGGLSLGLNFILPPDGHVLRVPCAPSDKPSVMHRSSFVKCLLPYLGCKPHESRDWVVFPAFSSLLRSWVPATPLIYMYFNERVFKFFNLVFFKCDRFHSFVEMICFGKTRQLCRNLVTPGMSITL